MIRFGLPIRNDGIDDPPQLVAKLGDDLRAGWIVGLVDPFLRIGGEIEQLGRVTNILVILPAAFAQHECAGRSADRVIL